MFRVICVCCLSIFATHAVADPPEIVEVTVTKSGGGYRFAVTIAHGDTGWDHYADGFMIMAPDGSVLGERVLFHPHVNEQPFTRSSDLVVIPADIDRVEIRAKDNQGAVTTENPIVELVAE